MLGNWLSCYTQWLTQTSTKSSTPVPTPTITNPDTLRIWQSIYAYAMQHSCIERRHLRQQGNGRYSTKSLRGRAYFAHSGTIITVQNIISLIQTVIPCLIV